MTLLQVFAVVTPAALAIALAAGPGRAAAADPELTSAFGQLGERRVFFGHQSVGANLLDGVGQLAAGQSTPLKVVETKSAADVRSGTLAHAYIGENGDPAGKLAAFDAIMRGGMGDAVDVAFMKFCYVDFDARTDPKALFERYQATMRDLAARYPKVTFVHLTVPLTTIQTGKRAWLKRLLGQPVGGVVENVRREEYNALVRRAYAGKGLFDLAREESTRPDGSTEYGTYSAIKFPVLVADYTDDGGHLNGPARTRIARDLLVELAADARGAVTSSR